MKIIETLSDYIEEEIGDAEKYIDHAIAVKDDDPDLADVFYKLSSEEMGHMKMLHDEVTKLIAKFRKEHGEPPAPMLAVYDYLHKKFMDYAATVKAKQMLYKE